MWATVSTIICTPCWVRSEMDEKTDGSETMTHTLSEKKRTLIFINIIISCVASAMLVTALTTALPAVADDLQISLATGQWLTSGYSLVMGMMMPLTAFLITRFPTKKLYLTGLGISLAGLLLCAGAPNFAVVMFARALQAIGNGVTASMGQVIILTIYPPERRGTAMAGTDCRLVRRRQSRRCWRASSWIRWDGARSSIARLQFLPRRSCGPCIPSNRATAASLLQNQ